MLEAWCHDCGEQQRDAAGGPVCENGHGGAQGVSELAGKALRACRTSEKLAAELAQGDGKPVCGEGVALFEHANRSPEMRGDVERVVERIFGVKDVSALYDELEAALSIGEQRGDRGTVSRAADNAEEFARQAHRLYCVASYERTRFEIDAEVVQGAMWSAASDALEGEKARGERKKQITDADVRGKASAMYPDEWKHIQLRRAKVKLMVENCERLADLWKERCQKTAALLKAVR